MGRASFGPLAYALPGRPWVWLFLVLWAVARVPSAFPAVREDSLFSLENKVNKKFSSVNVYSIKNPAGKAGGRKAC